MTNHYRKGANAERELMQILYAKGFALLRAAGSGVNPLDCPDVIALKDGRILAFECKAWNATSLALSKEQFEGDVEWCKRAGAEFWIAWRMPREDWLFLKPQDFRFSGKNYLTTQTEAREKGILLDALMARLG